MPSIPKKHPGLHALETDLPALVSGLIAKHMMAKKGRAKQQAVVEEGHNPDEAPAEEIDDAPGEETAEEPGAPEEKGEVQEEAPAPKKLPMLMPSERADREAARKKKGQTRFGAHPAAQGAPKAAPAKFPGAGKPFGK